MLRILSIISLIFTIIVYAPSSHANDDVKDLAIGLGLGLIMKGVEESMSEQNKNNANTHNTSQQGQQEIIEIQQNLKELGFYKGPIDGLKGGQTSQAIKLWRDSVDSDMTGDLDFIEKDVLNDHATNAREVREHKQKQKANSSNPEKLEERLRFVYRQYYTELDNMKICTEFKDSPHFMSASIDNDIHQTFEEANKHKENQIKIMRNCYNISEDRADQIKKEAYVQYKDSSRGQIAEEAMILKHRIDDEEAYQRVKGCNQLSRRLLLSNAKNITPTCAEYNETFERVGK